MGGHFARRRGKGLEVLQLLHRQTKKNPTHNSLNKYSQSIHYIEIDLSKTTIEVGIRTRGKEQCQSEQLPHCCRSSGITTEQTTPPYLQSQNTLERVKMLKHKFQAHIQNIMAPYSLMYSTLRRVQPRKKTHRKWGVQHSTLHIFPLKHFPFFLWLNTSRLAVTLFTVMKRCVWNGNKPQKQTHCGVPQNYSECIVNALCSPPSASLSP